MTEPSHSETAIEVICPQHPRGGFLAAIVDFDGTLSLLRRNWQDVMIPMMVDELLATGTRETSEALHAHVEEFVMRLNGRQTIYQMMQLAEEVRLRGGVPKDPLAYKHQYHDLLWREVGERVEGVRHGRIPRESMTVPDAADFLQQLRDLGLTLYLASGTDLKYVRDELQVIGLEAHFGPRVFGALDDYRQFSKAKVVGRIIAETGVQGHQILGVGDGFVEIEEVKRVGGLAIGVASDEVTRTGINAWKRDRLVRAGADIIIGDYRCRRELLQQIGLTG